ncbi:hypothetical protein RRG08_029250 [Elysia crispata]|uniref:Uncharacterized protein n=1 Tax=Elysia crispata TaxID=231223 RepID=A0AAE1E0X1_9GAST|nr:hypothetical protein RRG08_029250 [Elysia crispata]
MIKLFPTTHFTGKLSNGGKKIAFHLITFVVQSHILHNKVQRQRQGKVREIEQFMRQPCKALAQEGRAMAAAKGEEAARLVERLETDRLRWRHSLVR